MVEGKSTPVEPRLDSIKRLAFRLLNALFNPPFDRFSSVVSGAWLAALIVAGLVVWGIFFSWGDIAFDFHDWAEVTGPRYAFLKDAAEKGVFPLHAGNATTLRGVTDRYLAIPDTPISPQYLLLRYLNAGQYIFLDTFLFYLAGSLGLVLFYRKYRLSPFVFTILFLLFHFNGNMVNHLAVGHSIWVGQFLLPFFVLLVFDLIEKQGAGWKWLLGMVLLFLVILLQGAFHLYLWSLIFLGSLALVNLRLLKPVLLAGFFSAMAALPRMLPPALILKRINHEYLGGFGSVTDMLASLIVLRDPDRAFLVIPSQVYPLGWWELNYFIGLVGFLFVAIFGVILPLRGSRSVDSDPAQVLAPSLALGVLSLGWVYDFLIRLAPIPPFTGERVTSRFFILSLVFVMFLGARYLQEELQKKRHAAGWQVIGLVLIGVLLHDLLNNLIAWRIRYIDGMTYLFPKIPFDQAQFTVANHSDPIYSALLAGGAAVSLAVLVFLIVMALRERGKMAVQR